MSEISQQIAQISTMEEMNQFRDWVKQNKPELSVTDMREINKKREAIMEEMYRQGDYVLRPLVQPATREAINRIRNSEE